MLKQIKNSVVHIIKDEKGGPGIEEAVLLVFIGLIVATAADNLGDMIASSFAKSTSTLKTALGIS